MATAQDKKLAAQMVGLSLSPSGALDAARVAAVIASTRSLRPARARAVLKLYRAAVGREVRATTARIEHAGVLPPAVPAQVAAHFTARSGRPVVAEVVPNPALLAGVRITVGDDVFDNSVAGRLSRLAEAVAR